jgi:rSAM/selenodomain-associated transferase 1
VSIVIRFEGGDEKALREWLGSEVTYEPQGDGDLGQRMYRAFLEAFQQGSRRVVLVGTDIPGLHADILKEAFDALESCDVVLGPAKDGGYYLMGLLEPIFPLFQGLPWGKDSVLARTVEIAKRLGLQLTFAQTLQDLDRVEDLHLLEGW